MKSEKKKPCDWCLEEQMKRDNCSRREWYSDECNFRDSCPCLGKKSIDTEITYETFKRRAK